MIRLLMFISFVVGFSWQQAKAAPPRRSPTNLQTSTDKGGQAIYASAQLQRLYSALKESPSVVENIAGNLIEADNYALMRTWNGLTCRATLKNTGLTPMRPKNVILFHLERHGLPAETPIYGESFQMLHQHGGTLGHRKDIGNHSDWRHYRIPELHGIPTACGVLNLEIEPTTNCLLGFTTCHRFIGRISFDENQLIVSVDTEGLALQPGETWNLEDFCLIGGHSRGEVFHSLAEAICRNHPQRLVRPVATGWCSWYCYRMEVTDEVIRQNLNVFRKTLPELQYIQLDDGYQPYFGDWFDPNPAYGDVQRTIADIRSMGFEPAIWVAPFIAQKESRVLREHPDWFVKNSEGEPLDSSSVTFGGWRHGPWYALDGTNPEVQHHFENIFRTMREEWGINYFKLDANYWGAIQNGRHFQKNASRIEAYRQGMSAILRGCAEDTVVLGCNAPIWPSFGLVTAMRTSGDIRRNWKSFKSLAKQNLSRCWQNGTLWDSDPDCVVLAKDNVFNVNEDLSLNEWLFHATSIHAVGGFTLSGDKAASLREPELRILRKLLKPTGKGAQFSCSKLETGFTDLGDTQYYYFFNWGDEGDLTLKIPLVERAELIDFWSGESLGTHSDTYTVKQLRPRTAKLIVAKPKKLPAGGG